MAKVPIKTEKEIQIMREGGKLLAQVLKEMMEMAQASMDCWDFEEYFIEFCRNNGCIPACKGYSQAGLPPYPTGLCFSINEQSVHCYPVRGRKLQNGDLVTIDTVIEYKGYFLDSAVSFGIGNLPKNSQKILDASETALKKAILCIKPGIKSGVISNTIEKTTKKAGYSVLHDYAGHGIGEEMHEPPEIPCFGKPNDGVMLQKGMVLAVEPLVCENSNVLEHNNFWETKTVDNGIFVQVEHTVLVTEDGCEILTKR